MKAEANVLHAVAIDGNPLLFRRSQGAGQFQNKAVRLGGHHNPRSYLLAEQDVNLHPVRAVDELDVPDLGDTVGAGDGDGRAQQEGKEDDL